MAGWLSTLGNVAGSSLGQMAIGAGTGYMAGRLMGKDSKTSKRLAFGGAALGGINSLAAGGSSLYGNGGTSFTNSYIGNAGKYVGGLFGYDGGASNAGSNVAPKQTPRQIPSSNIANPYGGMGATAESYNALNAPSSIGTTVSNTGSNATNFGSPILQNTEKVVQTPSYMDRFFGGAYGDAGRAGDTFGKFAKATREGAGAIAKTADAYSTYEAGRAQEKQNEIDNFNNSQMMALSIEDRDYQRAVAEEDRGYNREQQEAAIAYNIRMQDELDAYNRGNVADAKEEQTAGIGSMESAFNNSRFSKSTPTPYYG